jgi:hypothetical protein
MSRVLRTGLTGLPLTSVGHRLLLVLNDPEVTITASKNLTTAPVAAPATCLLSLPLFPDPAAAL